MPPAGHRPHPEATFGGVAVVAFLALLVLLAISVVVPASRYGGVDSHPGLFATGNLTVAASLGVVSSPNGCGGTPIDAAFHSTVTGGVPPYRYTWTFGDRSASSQDADPVHVYSQYGSYRVYLNVTDASADSASTNLTAALVPPPCPSRDGTISSVPWSLLLGVALVALLASGLGFALYRARRGRK